MDAVLLPLHLLFLAFVAWNVVLADHMGLSWIQGKDAVLNRQKVQKYHIRISVGLSLMILTGFFLFYPMREFLLERPQFFAKMAFVAGLIVNAFVIGHLQKKAITRTFASLSFKEKLPLFISGAVSTLCWLGAAAGGYYLIPN